MEVLQICNDYFGTKLYDYLFDELEHINIHNKIYVPVPQKSNIETKTYNNIYVYKCFDNVDRVFFFNKGKKACRGILNNEELLNIDIMHAHTLYSNGYIAYLLYKKYNIPYIVAIRNTDLNIFFKYMIHLRKVGIDIIRNASKVIFLSDAYKKTVVENYISLKGERELLGSKFDVVPNGINEFWFKNKYDRDSHKAQGLKKLNILCVGEINKNKNQLTAALACDVLRNKGYNVTLNLVGKISNEKVYKRLNKFKFVKYLGTLERKELLDVYRSNDIFLLPSKTETFGLVYAEAMSQGLPVIYTKGQGFDKQFPEGKVGYGVRSFEEIEIADKLLNIVENYDEISANCTKLVDKFKWEIIANKYKNIYEQI